MRNTLISHAVFGGVTAMLAAAATYVAVAGWPQALSPTQAHAQAKPPVGLRQTELVKVTMDDVMGRVVSVRRFERDPGTGSDPHRHPGSHTFGYVLEGTYDFQLNDGPVQQLKPGDTFYEPPNALHAVSRNSSKTDVVKFLVIQVSDPTKPATVPEKK
jgi:quercetin dioxygenase-like cupin family protein